MFFSFISEKKAPQKGGGLKGYTNVYEKRWIIRHMRKIKRNGFAKLRRSRLKRDKECTIT